MDRYGQVKIIKLKRAVDDLRNAIRSEGTPAIQDAWDRAEPWADRIFTTAATDLARPKVKPLQCDELRNNNWQMGPYQIRFSKPGVWRITFYGKSVCRQIKGHDAAKAWVQKDHERRVLDALE